MRAPSFTTDIMFADVMLTNTCGSGVICRTCLTIVQRARIVQITNVIQPRHQSQHTTAGAAPWRIPTFGGQQWAIGDLERP